MIGHQTEGTDNQIAFRHHITHSPEKPRSIFVAQKDRQTRYPATHHTAERTLEINPCCTAHHLPLPSVLDQMSRKSRRLRRGLPLPTNNRSRANAKRQLPSPRTRNQPAAPRPCVEYSSS